MDKLRNKVIEKLIQWGNNEEDVQKMVEEHFTYAYSKYKGASTIAQVIRTIY